MAPAGVSSAIGELPQIAHRASPRTLAAGEKHGRDSHSAAVHATLVFDEDTLMAPRVVMRTRTTVLEDEAVALAGGSGIDTHGRPYSWAAGTQSGVKVVHGPAIAALVLADASAHRLGGHRAVLESPLREHRHVEPVTALMPRRTISPFSA